MPGMDDGPNGSISGERQRSCGFRKHLSPTSRSPTSVRVSPEGSSEREGGGSDLRSGVRVLYSPKVQHAPLNSSVVVSSQVVSSRAWLGQSLFANRNEGTALSGRVGRARGASSLPAWAACTPRRPFHAHTVTGGRSLASAGRSVLQPGPARPATPALRGRRRRWHWAPFGEPALCRGHRRSPRTLRK